jgi:hypothetical protein
MLPRKIRNETPFFLKLLDRGLQFVIGVVGYDLFGNVKHLFVRQLFQARHYVRCLAGERFISSARVKTITLAYRRQVVRLGGIECTRDKVPKL